MDALIQHSPLESVGTSIRGGLAPGELGAVLARAGVGKAAMLVHIALHALLRGNPVLHVALADQQPRVRAFYDEILGELVRRAGRPGDLDRARAQVERHRVIHSRPGQALAPDDLHRLLDTLAEVMDFHPTVAVVHGIEGGGLDADGVAAWRRVARAHRLRLWMAVRTHRDEGPRPEALAPLFDTAVALEPRGAHVALTLLRGDGAGEPAPVRLDPVSMVVVEPGAVGAAERAPSPHPERCTLYATGAEGAEAAFGEVAERWGVREVHFTFEGHAQARTRGRRLLDERELRAGRVSMLYVNRVLGRHWERDGELSRVLAALWHVVGHAGELFVVGSIQPDGTVHGGTGWSVELARRWHKPVWVFDQERGAWFGWTGEEWAEGLPVIETPDFAGTGTRRLDAAGRRAIEELFDRSFGR